MVRALAPPVPTAACARARAVVEVGCGSYHAGGSPPVADPREQRTEQPDSVRTLKMATTVPSSSSSTPTARARARRRNGRADNGGSEQKGSAARLARRVRQAAEAAEAAEAAAAPSSFIREPLLSFLRFTGCSVGHPTSLSDSSSMLVYMSSKILQLAVGSRDLSQAEKRVIVVTS